MAEDDPRAAHPHDIADAACAAYGANMGRALSAGDVPEYAKIIMSEAARGASVAEMAGALGVSQTAMMTLARNHGAFNEALREARTISLAWWWRLTRLATADKRLNRPFVAKIVALKARWDDDGNLAATQPAAPAEPEFADAAPTTTRRLDTEVDSEIHRLLVHVKGRTIWAN